MPAINWDWPWQWQSTPKEPRKLDPAPFDLTDAEMNKALTFAENSHEWRTLMQIIRDSKDSAARNACMEINSGNPISAAGFNGAWEALDSFQAELERRRNEGLQ